jgi:DNA-binding transcriptional LysR family regulator
MPHTFDLDTLRALIAIADLKSFSRAAEQLGRSQSAISLQIARLETLTGHALLQRSRGRVVGPTARGAELITHARQMVDLNARAVAAMRRPLATERVRIGLPADALERGLSSMLDDIRSHYPDIQLAWHTDLSAQLVADLDQGRLDLAVFKRTPSNVAGKGVGAEPMAWYGRMMADAARRDAPVPLVLFARGCAYRETALRSLDQAGRDWRIVCEVRSLAALLAAVNAGLGCTALPVWIGAARTMSRARHLPELAPVELVLGIAEGCELPAAQAIGAMIARHCAQA